MCSSLGVWEPRSCIPLLLRALVKGGEPIVRMRKLRPENNVTASASPTARVWVPCSQPSVHFWTRGTPHSRSSPRKPAGLSCSGSRLRLLSPLSMKGLSLTRTVQGWGLGRHWGSGSFGLSDAPSGGHSRSLPRAHHLRGTCSRLNDPREKAPAPLPVPAIQKQRKKPSIWHPS